MSKTIRSELHDELRQAAKAPHGLVDRPPLLAPLLRNDLTEGQYGDLLVAFTAPTRRWRPARDY